MSKTKKVLRTVLVAGVLSALAALATFSAFSATTDNPGNNVTAGTVALSDNDAGSAAYNLASAKPGQSSTPFCVKVSYTGSLDSDVRLYTPSTVGTLAPYVNLKVETGSGSQTNCSDFSQAAGDATLFNSTLDTFPTSYASGILDSGPTNATKWSTANSVTYRVTATLSASATDTQQGLTTGSHTLRFEARNQ
jgi:hypothetical protein